MMQFELINLKIAYHNIRYCRPRYYILLWKTNLKQFMFLNYKKFTQVQDCYCPF